MGMLDRFKKNPDGGEDQSKAEMDAMFAKFGEIIDERLKPVNESVSGLKSEWETIKAEATKPPVVDNRPKDEHGNPRALTPEETQRNLNIALAEQNVQNAARWIEESVVGSLKADWKHVAGDLRKMFADTPVARKAQPDYAEYCKNCATLVIGREAESAGLRRKENGEFFLEDKSGVSGEPDSILNDPSLVWHYDTPQGPRTMSAKEQLAKLHIDPKEFEDSARKGRV